MSENSSSKKKSKTRTTDPEKVLYAENYLQTNMAHYPIESLKTALLAGGYSEAEINQAVFNMNNPHATDSASAGQFLPDIGFLFSNAWNFFKDNFLVLFAIQLIAQAPSILLQIKNSALLTELDRETRYASYPETLLSFREFLFKFLDPVNIILVILIIPLALLGTAALLRAVILKDTGKEIDIIRAYKNGLPYVLPYFLTTLMYGIIVVLGIILLIIPGVIFSIWLLFYGFVITYEKKGTIESLKRSRELVRGYWWGIFGRYLLGVILVGLITGFLGIFGLIPYLGPIFQGVIQAASAVFITVYLYNIYKSLRAIKG